MDLSKLQVAVMRVLWDRHEATPAEVHRILSRSRPLAITTVATLLARLEKRGAVSHRREGRALVYRAAVSERQVRRTMLGGLVRSLFRSDPGEVVSHLLAERDVSASDIAKIHELLKGSRARKRKTR
ncbi:MAG TPA: BlaI/MecI/CopY family transcriptional regulator [Gemmatimonadales bacterium]|nr:BlaI/MecI/CopY family transcriptional regulator [Gemmatimonadales bacterium]